MTICGLRLLVLGSRSFFLVSAQEAKAVAKAVRFVGVRLSPTMPRMPETLIIRLIRVFCFVLAQYKKKREGFLNFCLLLLYYMPFLIEIRVFVDSIPIKSYRLCLYTNPPKKTSAVRQKNARNRARKKELKVLVKNMQKLVDAGAPKPEVEVAYRSAVQKLDRLGIKNYIHANKASRKKSQLARILNEYGKAE